MMEEERLAKLRNEMLNQSGSMGSQEITDFDRDGIKIREAFFQMLIDKLPLDIVENILHCITEIVMVNFDWGDVYAILKKGKQVTIRRLNKVEELSNIKFKIGIVIIETTDSNYDIHKVCDMVDQDEIDDWTTATRISDKDAVTLLEFD